MLGSLLCDAIAAKREDIFKAAIDGRSCAAWASLASPTCRRNGPGSAKWSVFPRTDPVSNSVSTNTGLRRGETEFWWAETKEPKRSLISNRQLAQTKRVRESLHEWAEKNFFPRSLGAVLKTPTGAEQPSALSLTLTSGGPPSPSPSIPRRRTPAALAVGVHSF